ncbi:S8 family peptidase [Lysobacter arvi]|uniref:S8 family serine peptidase n=1 Tax=Lysobacter arvi TaxID=3038776 RepID=A0ABU1CGH1_9GAMM|nr:S8 family peptidase [Lysobacter arvi]MDR0184054.1 S8 family serine peptidase [Lysobacter arvi]
MTFRRTLLSVLIASACLPATAGTVDLSSLQDATVSPRFIVKYRDGSAERTQAAASRRALAAAVERARPQMGPRLANLRGAAALRIDTLRVTATGRQVVRASQRLDRAQAEALMRAIASDPNVESVSVDRLMRPSAMPNDPVLATHQLWHYGTGSGGARVTTAWSTGATGAGIVVAMLDTGATRHADLMSNLLDGYDFITDRALSGRPTDDRVPGGWDLGDFTTAGQCAPGSPASPSSWHGTHVSGTIAEVTNNEIGGAGVAYDAKIVPVRVLGRCGGYTSDINDAIVWAAGGHVDGVPDNPHPAEVINMSLGGTHACEADTQAAIDKAVSLGATVVVAAGNDNADATGHAPASCARVVTVGATGFSGQRAGYSNYGSAVDLSAPGGAGVEGSPNGYIWSTHNTGATVPEGDRYVGMTGTSMATPHVAGIVALMQGVAATPLTPAQIEGLLVASARPFPIKPDRAIGAGIVDATAAVERARTFGQPIQAIALTSNITEAMPPLAAGQSVMYAIDVPEGRSRLEFTTYGGRGTLAAYANYESEPMPAANIASSVRPGTNQVLNVMSPAKGRYYIKVVATADAAGVLVRARIL